MAELSKCRLCCCSPVRSGGGVWHEINGCPVDGENEFTESQWQTLMGQGEAVAFIGDAYSLHWIGSGPIAPIIERTGLKPGDKLYTQAHAIDNAIKEAVVPVDVREMAFCEGVYAMAAEVKHLCKDFSDMRDRPYMGDVTAAIDGLAAQVSEHPAPAVDAAVLRDAARYRWLCAEIENGAVYGVSGALVELSDETIYDNGEELSAAIDAAMKRGG